MFYLFVLQNKQMTDKLYKFIHDEAQLRAFHKQHIAPLAKYNMFSFILIPLARKKYWNGLSRSQMNLNTRIISSKISEEDFIVEIRRYEIREGLYRDRSTPIPSEAMAIYMTVNPMNEIKSFFKFNGVVSTRLSGIFFQDTNDLNEYEGDPNRPGKKVGQSMQTVDELELRDLDADDNSNGKLMSHYKSCLHKSQERHFCKLDVDTKDPEKIAILTRFFAENRIVPHLVVESRGGYHVLLSVEALGSEGQKRLHFFLKSIKELKKEDQWVSYENNPLVVLPGTNQGGYQTEMCDPVTFIKV